MKTVISVVAAAAVGLSTGNRHFIDVTASEQNGIQTKHSFRMFSSQKKRKF